MTTLVVGDVQGCYGEFRELLAAMQFREGEDRLWLVGDLVNRGPDNVATMDYVMSVPGVVTVLGNHDLHFLAVARGFKRPVRGDTLEDLLASPRLGEIVDWLRRCPLFHRDPALGCVLVHAGVPPIWTLDECARHAREVETVLAGDDYDAFLREMYGNQPDTWDEQLAGQARLRIITNYLTRLRYCTPTGRMELTHKEKVRPEGFTAWFDIPRPAGEDATILFGHWAALEGRTGHPDRIALDTGCVWGRSLTGLRLEDRMFFSVPSRNR